MTEELETKFGAISVTECRGDLPERFFEKQDAAIVGVDTETTGLDWGQEELGLIQVYVPDVRRAYLVRPTDDVPTRLMELLESSKWPTVFHYALFDLRFLRARWEFVPSCVKCTKVSAKLLYPSRDKHSLSDLLREHLEIEMSKPTNVRTSDWTADELSEEQLTYAALDAVYLPHLFRLFESELRETGRGELAKDCFSFIPHQLEADLLGVEDLFGY